MEDFKIIIPIHLFDEEIEKLLHRAINSVPSEYPITISCAKGLDESISDSVKDFEGTIEIISSEGEDTSFQHLVNQAVGGTKWFSILEFDDEYTNIWFDEFKRYSEYKPEVSVFMPLTDLVNFGDNKYVGYGNESPWASAFSEKLGYVDHECLENFFDFYLTGSVFNTEDWQSIKGLKESLDLTFWYEFLLRLTKNDKEVYVIPKVGYKHYVNRKDSLFDICREKYSKEDSEKLFEKAKQSF